MSHQNLLKPMLAHDASKHASKITYPCFVQPKLDGVRCTYQNGHFYTRNNKIINSCPQLLNQIRDFEEHIFVNARPIFPLIFDGELRRLDKNFQETVSSVRKTVNIDKEDMTIEYHIFDIIDTESPFSARSEYLKDRFYKCGHLLSRFRFVPTFFVSNHKDLLMHYKIFLENGHEGIIIRNPSSRYEPDKRSFNLLKMKPTETLEAKIINTHIGEGKYSSTLGALCVRDCSSGIPFFVGSGFDDTQRHGLWSRRFEILGKIITVKHQGFTNDGTPRFPIFVDFRDYE